MADVNELKQLKPQRQFFIGLDSDGCVFNTMELKQKECFCPHFIEYFGLQGFSHIARKVWEFVNLYSRDRGCNRYIALKKVLELMLCHPRIDEAKIDKTVIQELEVWAARETKLSLPALAEEVERTQSETLLNIHAWSQAVNKTIERIVHDVPPFPFVEECLSRMYEAADIIVVSQTPLEALKREWREAGIDRYIQAIAGQEYGAKRDHIRMAAQGKYNPAHSLMIGDAPGDYNAAVENGAMFYPVLPGREEESWKRLHNEALGKIIQGSYRGAYEDELIETFFSLLPENPSWG